MSCHKSLGYLPEWARNPRRMRRGPCRPRSCSTRDPWRWRERRAASSSGTRTPQCCQPAKPRTTRISRALVETNLLQQTMYSFDTWQPRYIIKFTHLVQCPGLLWPSCRSSLKSSFINNGGDEDLDIAMPPRTMPPWITPYNYIAEAETTLTCHIEINLPRWHLVLIVYVA